MSSAIGPKVFTTTTTEAAAAAPATAQPSTTVIPGTAELPSLLAAAFAGDLSGLRLARNPEDSAIVLGQIALSLETMDASCARDRLTATLSGLRGSVGPALAAITTASDQMAILQADRSATQARIDVASAQQTALTTTHAELTQSLASVTRATVDAKAALTSANDELARLIGDGAHLDRRLLALAQESDRLLHEITAARSAGDLDRAQALEVERAGVIGAAAAAQLDRDTITLRLDTLERSIPALAAKLDDAETRQMRFADKLAVVEAEQDAVAETLTTESNRLQVLASQIEASMRASVRNNEWLVEIFSRIAVFLQTGGGERRRDAEVGAAFDRIAEMIATDRDKQRKASLSATEASATALNARIAEQEDRVAQVTLALLTGVAHVQDVLRTLLNELAPSFPDGSAGEAFESRLRLSV